MGLNRDRGRLNAKMTMANLHEDGVRVDSPDARLIAAAPELLKVVRMAIDYANDTKERFGVYFDGDDGESYDNLMDAAEDAIAKAEGSDE